MPSPSHPKYYSPYQLLYYYPPDYSHLRVFGYTCYPLLPPPARTKLTPKSIPCIFIGYATSTKGYKCLNLLTGQIYISRHVLFNESHFHYSSQSSTTPTTTDTTVPPLLHTLVPALPISSTSPSPITTTLPTSSASPTSPPHPNPLSTFASPASPSSASPPLSELPHIIQPTHPMVTLSKTGSLKLKFIFNPLHHPVEPTSFSQASKYPEWRCAMSQEFQALHDQGT